MSRNISFILSLLISSPIIIPNLISEAHAQENLFSANVQLLLPGQAAIADGETEITYQFLFLDSNGVPFKGLTGKTSLGKLRGTIKEGRNGIYTTTFKPEKISAPKEELLTVNLRNASRQLVKKNFNVKLTPTTKRNFESSSSPSEITLGLDDFVTVTVEQTSGTSTSQIDISSSVGTVENIVYLGNGKFSARYTPPSNRPYPHVALFTVTDLEDPKNTTTFTLDQKGKTNFPVNSLPDSNVILRISDRDFGPIKTDSSGKASIPIVVPPGVNNAKLIVINNGNRTEEPLDLRIPQNVPRINFFPSLSTIPADGNTEVNILVYVSTTTGKPDKNAVLIFKAEQGSASAMKNIGNGMYSVTYTPPLMNKKSLDNIRVVLQSETGDISDNLPISLSPTLPEKINLSSASTVIPKNAVSFNVITNLKDSNSQGMMERGIQFTANGAKILQSKELGSGDYTTKFSPTANGPIEITAFVKGSVSSNPPFGIAMLPNHSRLLNDGVSSSLLNFFVYDRYGYPIANQDLELEIVSGDGSLPSKIKTNSSGIGQVSFTAGQTSGVVTIKATSSLHTGEYTLLQLPANVLPELQTLPQSQNDIYQRLENDLKKSITSLRIERDGMEGAKIKANQNPIGDVEKITIKAEPAQIALGGKVLLKIRLADDAGHGIPGEKLETVASNGTVGRIQDLGGGQYSVTLSSPETVTDPIQVTINTIDNSVQETLQLEWVTSQAIEIAPTEEPKEETKEKKPRTPRSGEAPLARISAGYTGGFHHYQQIAANSEQELYREPVTFNSVTEGSKPAPSAGLQLRATGSVPNLKYLGYDINISMDFYSVLLSEFGDEAIKDALSSFDVSALGQYPIDLNGTILTPSLRLGFAQDDLLLFLQDGIDAGQQISLSYEPLWVRSLSTGIGVQVDATSGLFGSFNYDAGLRGSSLYRSKLVGQIGYNLPGNLFVFAGGKSTVRNVDIENVKGKIGEIHDMHRGATIGFGYGIAP